MEKATDYNLINNRKTKVLIYGMLGGLGGIETFLMTLYRNIDRQRIQFDFIFNHNQGRIYYEDEIKFLGGVSFAYYMG